MMREDIFARFIDALVSDTLSGAVCWAGQDSIEAIPRESLPPESFFWSHEWRHIYPERSYFCESDGCIIFLRYQWVDSAVIENPREGLFLYAYTHERGELVCLSEMSQGLYRLESAILSMRENEGKDGSERTAGELFMEHYLSRRNGSGN